jgi:hypothetical protein
MLLYPYTVSDVSPNAMRSTWNPDRAYIGRKPQLTNMSHEPRIEGWCGTTSDSSIHALGEFDTDDEDWFEDLQRAFGDEVNLDKEDIEQWMAAEGVIDPETGEPDPDFECDLDTSAGSRSCTWDEGDDSENWYPTPRDGWEILATYDNNYNEIEFLTKQQHDRFINEVDGCLVNAAAKVLDIIDLDYDQVDHETYNSGTCGTDWAVLGVHEDDKEDAEQVIILAADLLELVEVDEMEVMLKAWWAHKYPPEKASEKQNNG